jgi:enoyl-[acyl-carrier protein] reductase II
MMKNDFFSQVQKAENDNATKEELARLLGKGRAKRGMFEGDINEGELEIGQVSSGINKISSASEIVKEIWSEYEFILNRLLQ